MKALSEYIEKVAAEAIDDHEKFFIGLSGLWHTSIMKPIPRSATQISITIKFYSVTQVAVLLDCCQKACPVSIQTGLNGGYFSVMSDMSTWTVMIATTKLIKMIYSPKSTSLTTMSTRSMLLYHVTIAHPIRSKHL